jgi:hypothetical protein
MRQRSNKEASMRIGNEKTSSAYLQAKLTTFNNNNDLQNEIKILKSFVGSH